MNARNIIVSRNGDHPQLTILDGGLVIQLTQAQHRYVMAMCRAVAYNDGGWLARLMISRNKGSGIEVVNEGQFISEMKSLVDTMHTQSSSSSPSSSSLLLKDLDFRNCCKGEFVNMLLCDY